MSVNIKEYLIIGDTQYPMVPDGSENIEVLDSRVWNVYRGNELVGMITMNQFQPVVQEFERFLGMQVYLADKERDGEDILDIYALALQGQEIQEYDTSREPTDTEFSENVYVQEALPDERVMQEAIAAQKTKEEKAHQQSILQEATGVSLFEMLSEKHESVHNITAIFGKTIDEVISFLQEEKEIVGDDAVIGIHEDMNQRCIVLHESEEHRTERERIEELLRQEALSKLSKEERRALGLK